VREVSRFVRFAADIPSIAEPFFAGVLAGKYSLAGSASLANRRHSTGSQSANLLPHKKNLAAPFQQFGLKFVNVARESA